MYTFLTLLAVLVVLFITAKASAKEGFEAPTLPKNIPLPVNDAVINPEMASDLPGGLPTTPYQQIGRNLPSPYTDPSLIKTTRQRILNVLQALKGFLAFQATQIEDRSDPSIQLPLQMARGDFQRLQSEANVLQRNPGLTPHLTAMDIAQIEDNLAYLQYEVEMIGSNRPYQSSTHDADLEGFEGTGGNSPATLDELIDFSSRIQATIRALSISGTTDPIVQARIGNLTGMKSDVDKVIEKIQSKEYAPNQVPILRSDVVNALPLLGNTSSPLPTILQNLINNSGRDGSSDMLSTIQRYAETVFNNPGSGFRFSVDYNADKGQLAANQVPSTLWTSGFPSDSDLRQVGESPELNDMLGLAGVLDSYAQDPRAEGRTPMHFDWKQRSLDIVEQIQKRQMNPADFGVMDPKAKVSSNFSWKGYTKMICSRLQTVHPNKMDEMCGCPPQDWAGWGREPCTTPMPPNDSAVVTSCS
jgi:hypothetical protein